MRASLIGIVLVLLLIIAGCGGGGGGNGSGARPDTTPPTIAPVIILPSALRFPGGEVAISVSISDASGVKNVWAEVTKPDQSKDSVTLTSNGTTYQGSWTAPANINELDVHYQVRVFAEDNASNTTQSAAYSVVVRGIDMPPPPYTEGN